MPKGIFLLFMKIRKIEYCIRVRSIYLKYLSAAYIAAAMK